MIIAAVKTSTHVLSHVAIFAAYIAAMAAVPASFKRLMRIRLATQLAGAGFFLLCGFTHLSIILDKENAPFFTVTDHLQALSIWAFLVCLAGDLAQASRRLVRAFVAIRELYGDEVGDQLATTIESALKDDAVLPGGPRDRSALLKD